MQIRLASALLALSLLADVTAQSCFDQGSTLVGATLQHSPLTLGCANAPSWPQWHLYTPPHRAPAPHVGYRPGNAHAFPVLLTTWRCTGFLLFPIAPSGVRVAGYVIDRAEHPCH
ncbi:MAG TPA: hypothetical protein ENI87_05635 [bacterium]|nr:hypothetical protein [bacterium]